MNKANQVDLCVIRVIVIFNNNLRYDKTILFCSVLQTTQAVTFENVIFFSLLIFQVEAKPSLLS